MKMLNIKKLIAIILCASVVLGIFATSVSAQETAGMDEFTTTAIFEEPTTTAIFDETTTEIIYTTPYSTTTAPVYTTVAAETTTAVATTAAPTTTAAPSTTAAPTTTVPAEEETEPTIPEKGDTEPFRISNVVNGNTASKRGFTWYTKTPTDTVIEIYKNGLKVEGLDIVYYNEMFEGNHMHKATVDGLEAGTIYNFRVGNGILFSDMGTFVTDDCDDKVNFVAIADVQAGNLENFLAGAEVLGAAFKTMPEAEFVVNLGDMTDDSTNEEWDFNDYAFGKYNLNATLVPVAGNHDGLGVWDWFNNMFNLDTSESVQNLNGVNYSFDYGNAHFAVLNTNDVLSMSISQLIWLKNDMNGTDKDWKIVLMHKSPYSLGKDAKWPDALYLQSSLTKVLAMCDVDLVMSGHDHQYLRTKPLTNNKVDEDGTTFVLAGTAGKKRYEVRSFLANHFLKTENIAALTIQKDGYGNYWNGENWDNTKQTNIGGCFNAISIDGGKLTYNAYILADEKDASGNDIITNIDSFTLEKETGKNEATFSGDNTTSEVEFYIGVVPSFFALATYVFAEWLPKFLFMVPELLVSVIVDDVF